MFRALEVMRFIENDATLLSLRLRDIARSEISLQNTQQDQS